MNGVLFMIAPIHVLQTPEGGSTATKMKSSAEQKESLP